MAHRNAIANRHPGFDTRARSDANCFADRNMWTDIDSQININVFRNDRRGMNGWLATFLRM
jgi:hypothetical protein